MRGSRQRKKGGYRMADIRTVAAAAGVSIATVSRVLKTPDVVTKATRDKVLAAVEATGYRPNALASGLRRAKSDNIVVVVPFIQNPFFSGVIQGIEGVAFAEGYQVLLGESQNDQARLDSYAAMLRSKTADGLILGRGVAQPGSRQDPAGDGLR